MSTAAVPIAFTLAGSMRMPDVQTLTVNRRHVVSVRPSAFDSSPLDAITISAPDPKAKDLTGWLYSQ